MINKMVTFKVRKEALDEAKMLVREFVENIKLNEEDTLLYRAHQQAKEPTRFVHFMTFADEYAERLHKSSNYNEEFVDMITPLCEEEILVVELSRLAFHD
ncbi:MAG: antibiotic biosynthesis monooxygenase [Vicingaceae bacterium]